MVVCESRQKMRMVCRSDLNINHITKFFPVKLVGFFPVQYVMSFNCVRCSWMIHCLLFRLYDYHQDKVLFVCERRINSSHFGHCKFLLNFTSEKISFKSVEIFQKIFITSSLRLRYTFDTV